MANSKIGRRQQVVQRHHVLVSVRFSQRLIRLCDTDIYFSGQDVYILDREHVLILPVFEVCSPGSSYGGTVGSCNLSKIQLTVCYISYN